MQSKHVVNYCLLNSTTLKLYSQKYKYISIQKKTNTLYIFIYVCVWLQKFRFFIQWHIKLCGLFNTKATPVEEQQWYD